MRALTAALAIGFVLAGCGGDGAVAAPETGVRDCGTIVTHTTQGSMTCFDAAFAGCAPARVLVDNRAPVLTGVKVRYEIRGRSGADCSVSWTYVALPPNRSWEGKAVTCPYTPGPSFLAAFNERPAMTGCTGPLMAVING